MKFFDDPSELDDHIIPIIREYINSGDWDLVLEELEQHINILKTELARLDEKHPDHGFWMLVGCENISDISHTRGLIRGDKGEAFRQCLSALFGIRDTILSGQPFIDTKQLQADFHKDVDDYGKSIKEILLRDTMPEIWKKRESLKKGPKTPKSLEALDAAIRYFLEENEHITTAEITKKIKFRTKEKPIEYEIPDGDDYFLYFDPEENRIVQTGADNKSKSVHIRQIDKYLKRILKEKHTP